MASFLALDPASTPSIYQTAWTAAKINLGFALGGTAINFLLFDAYEPVFIALPLVLGALFSAIICLTQHGTIRKIAAAAGLIILSEAIVLPLQVSLTDALLKIPRDADSSIYGAIPALLLVHSLILIAIRLVIAVHGRLAGDR